jgi:hypothetical protein
MHAVSFNFAFTLSLFEVKTALGATTYILFPGSELVSCDTVKSFAAQAKIGKSFAAQRKSFTARRGKLKSRESSFLAEQAKKINCASLVNFKFSLYVVW